ncbi:MAG: hypothetical protein WD872_17045 [Pirellulaceae bacterium]
MSDTSKRGYSLAGLFVLVTASAVLVAGMTPLVRLAAQGAVDGFQLSAALTSGFLAGVLIGLLIGLLQFRVAVAAPMGAAAGGEIGLAAGLIALLPIPMFTTSAVAMLVGSGLIVAVALVNRRTNS